MMARAVLPGLVEASIADKRSKVISASAAIRAATLVAGLPIIGATSLAIGATSIAMLPVIAATFLVMEVTPSADHIAVVTSWSFEELARTINSASKQTAWTGPTSKAPERRGKNLSLSCLVSKSLECMQVAGHRGPQPSGSSMPQAGAQARG